MNLKEVIDNIYEKYLLRDFFAKIIPGFIFLLSIFLSLKYIGLFQNIVIDDIYWIFVIFVIGVSWIIALVYNHLVNLLK